MTEFNSRWEFELQGCSQHLRDLVGTHRPPYLGTFDVIIAMDVSEEMALCRATGKEFTFKSDHVAVAISAEDDRLVIRHTFSVG